SSEIYGGIGGFWDYGPLGVELKRNVKEAWWQDMVRNPPPGPDGNEISMVGLDCAIIMNPKVWEASGHVGGFADPMVDCKKCRRRFRADKVIFCEAATAIGSTPETPNEKPIEIRKVFSYESDNPDGEQGVRQLIQKMFEKLTKKSK